MNNYEVGYEYSPLESNKSRRLSLVRKRAAEDATNDLKQIPAIRTRSNVKWSSSQAFGYSVRKLIYWLFAIVGCAAQIYQISRQYFAYDTVTELTITRPTYVQPPAVLICSRYKDLVINDRMMERVSSEAQNQNLTIREIFSVTPTTDELITRCKRHSSNTYNDLPLIRNCSKYFMLEKVFKQNQICYSYDIGSNHTFEYRYLTNGYSGADYFEIHLNSSFLKKSKYMTYYLIPSRMEFRGLSGNFVENYRSLVNSSVGNRNFVTLSYSVFRSKLLEQPYKSNCLDYKTNGFQSAAQCYEYCVGNRSLQSFNKTSFSIMTSEDDETVDYQSLAESDLSLISNNQKLANLEQQCQSKCSKADCVSADFVPKIISAESSKFPGFELYASNEPEIITMFKAKISFVDYLSFALSCTGFWLGFSPLSFLVKMDIIGQLMPQKVNTSTRVVDFNNRNNIRRESSSADIWKELIQFRAKIEKLATKCYDQEVEMISLQASMSM